MTRNPYLPSTPSPHHPPVSVKVLRPSPTPPFLASLHPPGRLGLAHSPTQQPLPPNAPPTQLHRTTPRPVSRGGSVISHFQLTTPKKGSKHECDEEYIATKAKRFLFFGVFVDLVFYFSSFLTIRYKAFLTSDFLGWPFLSVFKLFFLTCYFAVWWPGTKSRTRDLLNYKSLDVYPEASKSLSLVYWLGGYK